MASNISNASDYEDGDSDTDPKAGGFDSELGIDEALGYYESPSWSNINMDADPMPGGIGVPYDYTNEGNFLGVPTGAVPWSNINMDADPMAGGYRDDPGMYTLMRGATATNPHPESFWSKIFGAENVDYTDIYGGGRKGQNRINEINTMRWRQATGQKSDRTGANTGRAYQPGDFYVGQPTMFGEAKAMPREGIAGLLNTVLPFSPDRAYPENTRRFQENLARREAESPGILERIKAMFSRGDSGLPTNEGEVTADFPRGYELAPTRPSDFEVTRPVSNVFSEGDDGGDVYSEGIFGLAPERASEIMGQPMLNTSKTKVRPNAPQLSDVSYNRQFEDFGVEDPVKRAIIEGNKKRTGSVTKEKVPLIQPRGFDWLDSYAPSYLDSLYRAQTGL